MKKMLVTIALVGITYSVAWYCAGPVPRLPSCIPVQVQGYGTVPFCEVAPPSPE